MSRFPMSYVKGQRKGQRNKKLGRRTLTDGLHLLLPIQSRQSDKLAHLGFGQHRGSGLSLVERHDREGPGASPPTGLPNILS